MADRTSINSFMTAVQEAQVNKEHICIDIVTMEERTNYTTVINGVHADDIRYIKKTNCVNVGGWRDPYSLTIPVTQSVFAEDATPRCPGWHGTTMQYTFRMGRLSTAFLFHQYDELPDEKP